LNLNIFDRLNNNLNDRGSFVKDFIKELNNHLEEKQKGIVVAVTKASTGLGDEKVHGYILNYHDNARKMQSEFKRAEELPEGIGSGYRLRFKNGKYTIDEELTRQRLEEKAQTDRNVKEYWSKCRDENADYFIKYKDEDGFDVENKETGFSFSLSRWNDLSEEEYHAFQENMTINYKSGTYVVKENL